MATGEAAPAVEKLRALIRIPTVNNLDPALVDTDAFDRLLDELRTQFPLLHERLELTRVGTHGLLFRWAGASSARPVVLMAHLDVVPVVGTWTRDPFGAELADGAVWGRGTLDDKGCVAGICEAVEQLLADGVTPAQDVWLSFGCDEEVTGSAARAAVAELRSRGVTPWFVVDEGGAVASEAFPGVSAPVAVVGVTEKGLMSVELRATSEGGHAATPARDGAVSRLARAIRRLDHSPMRPHLPEPTVELFERLAPHASGPMKAVLGNARRGAALLSRLLPRLGPESAAMARTTFAITTLSGSPAINVIAGEAKAGVNIRVLTGDTVADALAHIRRVVADDSVEVAVLSADEPCPVSPRDDAFELIEATIREVFPDAIPAPYVMMQATDSRFFTEISERVYRFAPFRMSKHQRETIHGTDEHLHVDDFVDGIAWYRRLLQSLPA